MPILIGILAIIVLFFVVTYICYLMAFAVREKDKTEPHELLIGEQFTARSDEIHELIEGAVRLPFKEVYITSRDGLKLYGRLYESNPTAPTQILAHGYRSNALRDFSGGLQLALECGCNALLIDQRAHGLSEGKCLSFGIKERYDILDWIDFINARYSKKSPIILTGISMGAATVMMTAELDLPDNVKGIIADSGYSSPAAIIKKVIGDMKYPIFAYHFVKAAGIIYGGFNIESASATESVSRAKIPILFIHGEDDLYVPCEMSRECFAACASDKQLLTVPNAGHGLSYLCDKESYCKTVSGFVKKHSV